MRFGFPLLLLSLFVASSLRGQSLLDLASRYHREGNDSLAILILTTLYEAHQEDTVGEAALLLRAEILLAGGDTSEALRDLKTLALSPQSKLSFRALEMLARIEPQGASRAEALYRLALKNEKREERINAFRLALDGFLENGDLEGAVDPLKWLIVELPGERESLQILLGNILWRIGRTDDARLLFSRYPDNSKALEALARIETEVGDTASAFLSLLKLGRPSALLADIFVQWGDTVSLDSLVRLAPSSEDFSYGRAYLEALRGENEKAESLASFIKEPTKRARILKLIGKYDEALRLVENDKTEEGLLLKIEIFVQQEDWIRARELLSRSSHRREIDSLYYLLAKGLFSHGLFNEALEALSSLRNLTPMDPIFNLEITLLKKLGREREADSLEEWLSRWGIHWIPLFTAEDLLPALNRFYQGASPEEVAGELYRMGAFREVLRLLTPSRSLGSRERKILASTLTRLFLVDKDTLLARKADSLFLTLPEIPPDYWVLHRYWEPRKARLPATPPPLLGTEQLGFIVSLASQGRVEEARNLALSLTRDLRNEALFSLYLASGELDSAFVYLNMDKPRNVFELARLFFEEGRYEASSRLFGFLERSGLKLEERARFFEIKALSRVGYWEKVEEVSRDYLKRFPWSKDREEIARLAVRAMLRMGKPKDAIYVAMRERIPDPTPFLTRAFISLGEVLMAGRDTSSPEVSWLLALQKRDWRMLERLTPVRDAETIKETIRRLLEEGEDELAAKLLRDSDSLGILRGSSLLLMESLLNALRDTVQFSIYADDLSPQDRGEFYYWFGILAFKRGNTKAARRAFFKGLGWAEGELRGKVAFKVATLLFQERRYEEASDYYRISLELVEDPSIRKDALHNLAVVYNKLHLADSALEFQRMLARSFPSTEEALDARFRMAYELLNRKRFKEARDIFLSLRGEMPTIDREAERTYWEGHSYLSLREYDMAIRDFSILRDSYGGVGEWGITGEVDLARTLAISGRTDEAKAVYMGIIQKRGEFDPFGQLAKEELEKLKSP